MATALLFCAAWYAIGLLFSGFGVGELSAITGRKPSAAHVTLGFFMALAGPLNCGVLVICEHDDAKWRLW